VTRAIARALLAFLLIAGSTGARAVDAAAYLLQPVVTLGEREIDLRMGVGSAGEQTVLQRDAAIGFGKAVLDGWFSELSVQVHRIGARATEFDAVDWENIVQLSEQGEWPVDLGWVLEVERPRNPAEGMSIRMGPLLQREFGRIQVNANLVASRHFQTSTFQATQWHYQLQAKYRLRQPLEFGLQAFGTLGSRDAALEPYARQVHRVGPVVMGKFPIGPERTLAYNVGLLGGTTGHSPDRTLRAQLEIEF
jgi:hypothetical protein